MVTLEQQYNTSGQMHSLANNIILAKEPTQYYTLNLSANIFNPTQNVPSIKSRNIFQLMLSEMGHFILNMLTLGKHQFKRDRQTFEQAIRDDDVQKIEELIKKNPYLVYEEDAIDLYDNNKSGFDILISENIYFNNNLKKKLFLKFKNETDILIKNQKLNRLLKLNIRINNEELHTIIKMLVNNDFKDFTDQNFSQLIDRLVSSNKFNDFFTKIIHTNHYGLIKLMLNHPYCPIEKISRAEVASILFSKEFIAMEKDVQQNIIDVFQNKGRMPPPNELYFMAILNGDEEAEKTLNKFFPYEDYKDQKINFLEIGPSYYNAIGFGFKEHRLDLTFSRNQKLYREELLKKMSLVMAKHQGAPEKAAFLQTIEFNCFLNLVHTPELLRMRLEGK